MKTTIKDFNIDNFTVFLKSAGAKDASHPIEISGGKMYIKASTAAKSFAKFKSIDVNILGDFSAFDDSKTYIFYLISLDKILKLTDVVKNIKSVSVEVNYEQEPNEEDRFIITHMRFLSDDVKLRINQKEKSLVTYMKQSIWLSISNVSEPLLKFDIGQEDMQRIKGMLDFGNIGRESKSQDKFIIIRYNHESKSMCLTSKQKDVWKMELNNNVIIGSADHSINLKFTVSHLDLLTKDALYSCHLKQLNGNWCLVMISNDNDKVFAGLIVHDDNEKEVI